jgi:hypothetical protein
MATRRSAQIIPDLFSAPPTAKAPEPLAVPQNKANTGSVASQPRLFLPRRRRRSCWFRYRADVVGDPDASADAEGQEP